MEIGIAYLTVHVVCFYLLPVWESNADYRKITETSKNVAKESPVPSRTDL